jgi:tryptophan halogenase
MSNEINSITIVGGGSAGWMSAATMIRFFPNRKITIIESPDYPIVGVGESTLGHINQWLALLGIREDDFMKECDASYKLSIKFTDFYAKGDGGYHYPFGPPMLDGTDLGFNDWQVLKHFSPGIPVQDFARCYNPITLLAEQNKIDKNESGHLDNFNFAKDAAYHFDAVKFGQWLKNNYCLPRGVELISSSVKNAIVGADGVESLILEDGTEHSADMYLDCTGFKSMLLAGALNEEFVSYRDVVPNNRAWATRLPYTDKEKQLEPFTNGTALSSGWVWNIPLWSRIGTGYVYSDDHITPEDALKEFQEHIGRDDLEFRDIKMRIGIHKNVWSKNVVGIGLAGGFIEPLESNGLFTVHEFLLKLTKSISKPFVNQLDRDIFNMSVRDIFDTFATFVGLHYKLSSRNDSPYWRDITERSNLREEILRIPQMQTDFRHLAVAKMIDDKFCNGGQPYIATGMHYPIADESTICAWTYQNDVDYKKVAQEAALRFSRRKQWWQHITDIAPTLYEHLADKYGYEVN